MVCSLFSYLEEEISHWDERDAGVRDATWDAAYDIYVKMDEKDKPVALIYKGAILQDTGEVRCVFNVVDTDKRYFIYSHGMIFP